MSEIRVASLEAGDFADWLVLAEGYKTFYETPTSPEAYAEAWRRLLAGDGVFGLGAKIDGRLVGIAHYLFHTTTWAAGACYLQDLYTAPAVRGRGVARALIAGVAALARGHGAARFYWTTRDSNASARRLYDQVARFDGFIRYDHPL